MKNLPKMHEEMAKLQGKLAQIIRRGRRRRRHGQGAVNGNMEVVACTFSDEAMKAATGNCSKT